MKTRTFSLPVALFSFAIAFGSPGQAADLYSEAFDDALMVRMVGNHGLGGSVEYVDYSNFTVGATAHAITEAPRPIPSSLATKGVVFKLDRSVAVTERLSNLVAVDGSGNRLTLVDNYRVRFDSYLRQSPDVTISASGFPNEAGTTEHMLWGVGYNATLPMGRNWRTNRGNGMWGWLCSEGGYGATNGSDATLIKNSANVITATGRNMALPTTNADMLNFFTPAFGDSGLIPHCPANKWVETDITVSGGRVTVEYKAVGFTKTKFFENIDGVGAIAGTIMLGYEDFTSTVSFDPDDQWLLVDNVVVEDLTPPSMLVSSPAPPTTFTGTPTTSFFTVQNLQVGTALTISAVNFSGTHGAAFALTTALPLVIPAGETRLLEFSFTPSAPDGVKTATLTLVSDDPQQPSLTITGIQGRRSMGTFLMAHYKLEETAGTTVVDASGNGVNGGFQVREPLDFGRDSLLSNPLATPPLVDAGKSIGFLPAQAGNLGNYINTNITHTPTFSISMWVRPSSTTLIRTLWQRDPDFDSTPDEICSLLLAADGSLRYRASTTTVIDSGPGTVGDDETFHVVVTHLDTDGFNNLTADRCRMYVNGLRIAEKTGLEAIGFGDYPFNPTVSSLHIASRTVAGQGYKGDMDDIQVYGAELTAEQIWDMYNRRIITAKDSPAFQITNHQLTGAAPKFKVEFPSSPSGLYTLFRSANLSAWEPVVVDAPGDTAALTTMLEDATPPAGPQFYLIKRK